MNDIANVEPPEEIEITPEMIRAGVSVFADYDSRFERPSDVVPEIFRAMWQERVRDIASSPSSEEHSCSDSSARAEPRKERPKAS